MSGNTVSCNMLFPEVSINPTVIAKRDGIVLEPVTNPCNKDLNKFMSDMIDSCRMESYMRR